LTEWYKNGQKKFERNYKDGNREGLDTWFDENGQKTQWYKNGPVTQWYKNGQKKFERNYKDGEKDGIETTWYENGQKKSEKNYKNGKEDGLYTEWYWNGQKRLERNWNEEGIEAIWSESGQKAPKEVVRFLNHYVSGRGEPTDQVMLDCRFDSGWTDSSYDLDIGMSLRIDPVTNKVCCYKETVTMDSGERIRYCASEG